MWLSGLVILVNAIGGVLLFLWGAYFFSSTMALLFAGFSVIQAITAGIAFLGLCNVRLVYPDCLLFSFVEVAHDLSCIDFFFLSSQTPN